MPSVLKIETVPIFTGSECLKALQIFSENENKKQNDNKTVTIDHPKPEDDKSDDEKTVNVKYLAQEDTLCTGPLTGGISVCRVSFYHQYSFIFMIKMVFNRFNFLFTG